jgi:protein-tyrosine sulfotransferase
VSDAEPIIIGACPRSGTTLLRRILDTHSAICCGPESSLLLPGRPNVDALALGYGMAPGEIRMLLGKAHSQGEAVDRFMAAYAAQVGTRRWAEKTPLNIRHLGWIWRHFPRARVIHVIRDGRDTVCSMREHPDRRLVDGAWVSVRRERSFESLVRRWDADVRTGIAHRGDPRYAEVRYEALVHDPRATLEPLFGFIGEPFEERVLDYRTNSERAQELSARVDQASALLDGPPDGGSSGGTPEGPRPTSTGSIHARSIGRWRADLSTDEQAAFKRLAGRLLIELGYELDDDW